jgi:hypothetical protein
MKDIFGSQKLCIRSKNNFGDLCKQTFQVLVDPEDKSYASLYAEKLILTEKFEGCEALNLKVLRHFKNKRLYIQSYGIKLQSFRNVLDWLNSNCPQTFIKVEN